MSTPTDQSNFLFEELDVLHRRGFRRELPAHIEQNLAPHIELGGVK